MAIFRTITIRGVPPLQTALDSHMSNIKVIRDTAQSAGVHLSPDAIADIRRALHSRSPSPEHELEGWLDSEPALEPSKNELEAETVRDVFKKACIEKSDPSS